jgi:hypothetical protein
MTVFEPIEERKKFALFGHFRISQEKGAINIFTRCKMVYPKLDLWQNIYGWAHNTTHLTLHKHDSKSRN